MDRTRLTTMGSLERCSNLQINGVRIPTITDDVVRRKNGCDYVQISYTMAHAHEMELTVT